MRAVQTTPRVCPVPGCGAPLKRGYLMCKECWHRVPKRQQRAVHATFRGIQRASGTVAPTFKARLALYKQARDAAIKAAEAAR